jgi:hypothetical protein
MDKAFDRDWRYLKMAVEDLEDFILAPQDSWPIAGTDRRGGPRDTGRLTVGYLMLSRQRLTAMPEHDPRQNELREANQRIDQVRSRWQANWSRKARKEFTQRLTLWTNYLNDLLDDHGRHFSGYPEAARWRTMLKYLQEEAGRIAPGGTASVQSLDRRLRSAAKEGSFVWEPEFEPAFPRQEYWYLYITFD